MATCPGCNAEFEVPKEGPASWSQKFCTKKCQKRNFQKYVRKWRTEDRKLNPEKYWESQHASSLKRNYSISLDLYKDMFNSQGGTCAICNKPESKPRKNGAYHLSVDHNHVTGKIRGLLCNNCNRAIGMFKDDIDALKKAIEYLERTDI